MLIEIDAVDPELEAKVATATMTKAELHRHFWQLPPQIRGLLRHVRQLPKAERDQLIAEGWARGDRYAVLAVHLAGAEVGGGRPADA